MVSAPYPYDTHAPKPLTEAQLTAAIAHLPGWRADDGRLRAEFCVGRTNVRPLFAAVTAVENATNHHARVTILYDTVSFELTTHDAGDRVTARDTAVAAVLGALAAEYGAPPNR
ncbi:4a-hydroxytetrahydrobiopterin dehydratase [Streptomyces sp. NPDC090025]|uniref:4a-hydroxytetrahydrobiopterin dehydratase n=1 Tax=Streptomyces sp. NPDC090025 TaxID=3365922 RepID=UPI003837FB7A